MNKFVLFVGILVTGFLVYQIKTNELSMEEAFSFVQTNAVESENFGRSRDAESIFDKLLKRFKNQKKYPQEVYGVVLPGDLELRNQIGKFFTRLSKTQKVDTFVILGEDNSGLKNYEGDDNIVLSEFGYLDKGLVVEVDNELRKKILANGEYAQARYEMFGYVDGLASNLNFIDKIFPEAEILLITISDDAGTEELEKLAQDLAEAGKDKNVVVIATTLFAQQNDGNVNKFHDELAEEVFLNFDKKGLEQLDANSKNAIFVLFEYLELVGAKKAEVISHFWDNVQTDFLVKFSRGEAAEADRELTIMAFGDMMLGRNVRTLVDNNGGLDYIFEKIKGHEGRFFEGADVVFGNLEGPIKGVGRKGGTAMVFAFNEDIAPFFKASGFNLLSISNNHALDQGWEGRDTTIAALEGADLPWCGHPSEPDKESVYFGEVGDKKFAFSCFQDITHNLDQAKAVELIRDLRDEVDYLLVSVHWGPEYQHTPHYETEVKPGREFIDAGADFVIGHHPHVVQTFEIYNGKMIFYSLGNFVFDQYWSQDTQEELAIGIVLDDAEEDEGALKTKVYLFPMRSDKSQSRLMVGEERTKWLEKFIGYGNYSEEIKNQIREGLVVTP